MHSEPLDVDPDPRRARTPPPSYYLDPAWHARTLERVFARTWHWLADAEDVAHAPSARPVVLAPGSLSEPLVLARDTHRELRALSNVCTHRGALVCDAARETKHLRCPYHGRRFDLTGHCLSAPEFDGVEGFPSAVDHLARVPVVERGPLVFAALAPEHEFASWFEPLAARLAHLPFARARYDAARSRDFEVDAHWALYVENYLEGFHVPYVHPELAELVDYASYRTELFPHGSLQIGEARGDEPAIEPPEGEPEHGLRIAGYYAWLFPATMLNVYPWGVSLNVVQPLSVARTRVRFRSYVWEPDALGRGAGGNLATVEFQDEHVVRSVQLALGARLRPRGRYAPGREDGVHQFHRLLARGLSAP
ncbi:MAG: aromatic ring-hydroxylating dioxygenase subunit alpha [Planctomycetes bacterium]|nr:aromatic ring-hydroxylating dioxygenase subunit alpha [Planctomycetota bacterium]